MLGEGAVRSLFGGLVAVNLLFLFLPVSIAAFLCLCVPYHPFIVSFLLSNLHTHMHTHTQTLTHAHTHQPWGVDLDHSLLPRGETVPLRLSPSRGAAPPCTHQASPWAAEKARMGLAVSHGGAAGEERAAPVLRAGNYRIFCFLFHQAFQLQGQSPRP